MNQPGRESVDRVQPDPDMVEDKILIRTAKLRIGEGDCSGGFPVGLSEWHDDHWQDVPIDGDTERLVLDAEFFDLATGILDNWDAEPGDIRRVGMDLFQALVATDAGRIWNEAYAVPQKNDRRTLFELETSEMRRVPWELLHDGTRPVFGTPNDWEHACLRYRNTERRWDLAPDRSVLPVRMLVLVGMTKWTELGIREEIDHLERLAAEQYGAVDLTVLRAASKPEVKNHLNYIRPHIFHFIGHRDTDLDGNGILWVAPEHAPAWPFDAGAVGELFESPPELIVLNTCDTQSSSTNRMVTPAVQSLHEALISTGPRALLTMQADVNRTEAPRISQEIYQQLWKHSGPVDRAVNHAHAALMGKTDRTGRWAIPILTLVGTDGVQAVLPMTAGQMSRVRELAAACEHKTHMRVDRGNERWELFRQLTVRGQPPEPRVIVVSGDGQKHVGKSTVLEGCATQLMLAGHRVTWTSFPNGENSTRDWLASLSEIAEGMGKALAREVEGDVDGYLRRAVQHFQDNADRHGRYDWGRSASSQFPRYDASGDDRGENRKGLLESFRDLVKLFCDDRDLYLILDHWDSIPDPDLRTLVECLRDTVKACPTLRLVISIADERRGDRILTPLTMHSRQKLVVKYFPIETFEQHVDALGLRQGLREDELDGWRRGQAKWLETVKEANPDEWTPYWLTYYSQRNSPRNPA